MVNNDNVGEQNYHHDYDDNNSQKMAYGCDAYTFFHDAPCLDHHECAYGSA